MAASLGFLTVLGVNGCSQVFGVQKKLGYSVGCMEASPLRSTPFKGMALAMPKQCGWIQKSNPTSSIQAAICNIPRSKRWWEKNAATENMIEIKCVDELVQKLRDAEDKLVILDFYSPSCGGCKALHPKICQIAEKTTDVIFLKVNAEEHKEICNCLSVHVFPVFRFYKGTEGRVCSMSCTPANVNRFKDALARYNTDRCGLGPAKGFEERELRRLASIEKTE